MLPEHTLTDAAPTLNPNWPPDLFSVAFVSLTFGKFAVLDLADLPLVSGYKWQCHRSKSGRMCAQKIVYEGHGREARKGRVIQMHRLIFGARPGEEIDHANRNALDNRRRNLRLANKSLNQANSGRVSSATGFRGVVPNQSGRRFIAKIKCNGEAVQAGIYATAVEAAVAYDRLAREKFGEFASLNFPDGEPVDPVRLDNPRAIRPVFCVELDRSFGSLSEAERAMKITRSSIVGSIRTGLPYKGLRWQFLKAEGRTP